MKKFSTSCLSDPLKLAYFVSEYNKWRRGVGRYKWHECPSKNRDIPLSPAQLTLVLDSTVDVLKKISKSKKVGVK